MTAPKPPPLLPPDSEVAALHERLRLLTPGATAYYVARDAIKLLERRASPSPAPAPDDCDAALEVLKVRTNQRDKLHATLDKVYGAIGSAELRALARDVLAETAPSYSLPTPAPDVSVLTAGLARTLLTLHTPEEWEFSAPVHYRALRAIASGRAVVVPAPDSQGKGK